MDAETKADVLEVELACTLERQEASTAKGKATKSEYGSLAIKRVLSYPRISDEACTQNFNASFHACEFIMQELYLKASTAIELLIP